MDSNGDEMADCLRPESVNIPGKNKCIKNAWWKFNRYNYISLRDKFEIKKLGFETNVVLLKNNSTASRSLSTVLTTYNSTMLFSAAVAALVVNNEKPPISNSTNDNEETDQDILILHDFKLEQEMK